MNIGTLITACILFVAGLFIRFGKGSGLIAGYNTLSKEEKEKYDLKGLSNFISNLLFLCALIEVAEAIFVHTNNTPFVITGFILLFILAVGAIIYANTGNRFKKKKR